MQAFEQFFQGNSAIMLLLEEDNGNIVDANSAAVEFYKYSYEDLCALNIKALQFINPHPLTNNKTETFFKNIEGASGKHILADHTIKDVQVFASPLNTNGHRYTIAIIHDITPLKTTEEISKRFEKIAENAIPFIGIANMKRQVYYFNKSMRKAFAVPENADLSTYSVFDFYTLKGKKIIKSVFKEIAENGFWKGENEMQSLDGTVYQVLQTIVLIKDDNGQPQYTSSTAIDITQQKQNEQMLSANLLRYQTLLKNASEGIHVVDIDLNVLEVNDKFCSMLGYTKAELFKLKVTDWDCKWNQTELKKKIKDLMNKSDVIETKHKRKDGTIIDVEINATSILIGDKYYLYASSRDVSERKKLELSVKQTLAQLKKISSRVPGVVYQYRLKPDGTSCFPYASDGIQKIYGLSAEDVKEDASKVFEKIYSDDLESVTATIMKSAKELTLWTDEYRVKLPNGLLRWVLGNAMPQREKDGSILWHGYITDVTARKKLEQDLLLAKEKIEMAMEQSHLTYWEMNMATHMFTFNDQFYKLYDTTAKKEGGYEMHAAVYAKEFFYKEDEQLVADAIKLLLTGEAKQLKIQHRIITRKGKLRYIDVRINVHVNESGEITTTYGCNQDVTEYKLAELALQQSEEKFKHLIAEMKIGVLVYDASAVINLFNAKALELLDLNEAQLLGKKTFNKAWKVIHEDGSFFSEINNPAIAAFNSKRIVKDVVIGVYRPNRKDYVWLLVTAIPELGNNNTVNQVIVTLYDITEKRKREAEIQKLNDELKELTTHLQRLRIEERNSLAFEIHDKLGQKLVGVKFKIDLLKSKLNDDKQGLSKIVSPIAQELEVMVKDFHAIYSGVNPTLIDDLEIDDSIESLINLYRKQSAIGLSYTSNLGNEKLPNELKRVLYKTIKECLNNLTVHAKAKKATILINKRKTSISLIIEDDGNGFNISKIDYKKQIGLIEMRESLQSIGGTIRFESLLKKGTSIKIHIPYSS